MYENKTKSRNRLERNLSKEKVSSKESDIFKLDNQNLPSVAGFFTSYGLSEEDYKIMAKKLNFYVKTEFPDYHSSLVFNKSLDSVNSFISFMLNCLLKEKSNDEFIDDVFFNHDDFNNDLFLLHRIEFEQPIFALDMQCYRRISNKNLKALYALFLTSFSKLTYLDFLSELKYSYASHIYESLIEGATYEVEHYQEMEKLSEEDEVLYQEAKDSLDSLEISVSEHEKEFDSLVIELQKEVIGFDKKELLKIKAKKLKNKKQDLFKKKLLEFLEIDIDFIIENVKCSSDENNSELSWDSIFIITAFPIDKNEIDSMYFDEISEILGNNGCGFPCSNIEIFEDKIIKSDRDILQLELKKLEKCLTEIIKMIDNEYYK